ncbi:hypothetical protein [Streptomyces levis]|uniref:hypothetical protein n=1 Tax=Streptomyces levis TaxID=285566 RepID=UPI0031D703A5
MQRWVRIPKKKLTPEMQKRVIERADKMKKALEARKGGATYKQIGQVLGISTSYARELVQKGVSEAHIGDAKEVLQMDLLRLDELQMRAVSAFRAGDLNQTERIMRIMRERRDILGLTTDSFKEQQAEQAGSITNNGIMVVQGSSENFVEAMMRAVGVDPNSEEAQQRLARIRAEEEAKGVGEFALKAPRPNELLMQAADSALNRNEGNIIQGEVVQIKEESI